MAGHEFAAAYRSGKRDFRGADLTDANLTDANLTGANLTDANLRHANLRHADLRHANLTDANLTGANLTDADLRHADLTDANLRHADLTDANLRHALLPAGVPVLPHPDAAVLAAVEAEGRALYMERWHGTEVNPACDTTHCRYGWTIHLSGEAGYALERRIGSVTAGALIYAASVRPGLGLRIPAYTGDEADVLADLRARAALDPLPVSP